LVKVGPVRSEIIMVSNETVEKKKKMKERDMGKTAPRPAMPGGLIKWRQRPRSGIVAADFPQNYV